MHKERVEGRKATAVAKKRRRERNSRRFLLQPISSLLSAWARVTDRSSFRWLAGNMRLT